jgi:hypothetical protein
VIEGRIAAGFSSSPMTEAPCYAERAVDALLTKGPGSYTEALHFLATCRTFLSGGTRIRTGDTMIFSHIPRPLGMRQILISKRVSVHRVSSNTA